MSLNAFIWAVGVRGIKPAAKLVLIHLANRHNKDSGRCDPRLSLLADDCEMSRATVLRHLADLEAAGLITRVSQGRDNGGRKSSQYDLHIEQRSQNETGGKGRNVSGQRSQNGGGKGRNVETPYIEPVKNHKEPDARERDLSLFSEIEEPESQADRFEDSSSSEKENYAKESRERDFDRFWSAYPKKAGKPAARKAWDKAIRTVPPDQIIDGAQKYAAWLKAPLKPGEFRPHPKHPQGWLNDQRWEDPEIHEQAPKRLTRAQVLRNSMRGMRNV